MGVRLTQRRRTKIIEALKAGMGIAKAAQWFHISKKTACQLRLEAEFPPNDPPVIPRPPTRAEIRKRAAECRAARELKMLDSGPPPKERNYTPSARMLADAVPDPRAEFELWDEAVEDRMGISSEEVVEEVRIWARKLRRRLSRRKKLRQSDLDGGAQGLTTE